MNPSFASWLAVGLAFAFVCPPTAEARSFRRSQIPNLPDSCGTCHFNNGGGGPRNAFGQDVESTLVGGNVDWAAIFALDSDDDGYTNGQELGDPDGSWRIGDPNPMENISEPGNADDSLCDNGTLESDFGETCDLADFGGESCVSQGFSGGSLSCEGCRISTANCTNDMTDMGMPEDMGVSDDMGSSEDMGGTMDMGVNGPVDMGTSMPDAGNGGVVDAGGGGGMDDDDGGSGCQGVAVGSLLWLLLPLGLIRRRRRH